ncbi:lipopolysaccharide assembly protein LapA domain-containing protein [Lysobacter sp. LF1]|uniref:Lipopolysaccharide assembly protein LapA domain-containing protein n=1 Tax=Lysobacter stagni TaxID=3045172 RepID=A0ABT6XHY6_9GAMM|nr:lipopolysaccharide assembly protein LapA domain-containing protein [Lysobacter sp. LF1]MDI9239767.1 lipopolysaccharide assembly protein LapA domain-containing protein [Lysobacter sp. LF1]
MRLLRFLIAILFLAAGAIVGALNRAPVVIDLAFARMPANLGVSLLVALLLGVLLGGLAISASVVLPLRRRLARAERRDASAPLSSGT